MKKIRTWLIAPRNALHGVPKVGVKEQGKLKDWNRTLARSQWR